ncbi:YgfZ/GcvT domain-containing protein [Thiocystis violacea]|uniref:CAF17-like 4Fe-4S cluster assembly/insertion protein YgfZ n=1 Tax=Thiocystis violacea TaxID=13725 RepID=UPI001905C3C1|nr:folate-binding protein YgfZ [Thiocystis violacea]MBK1718246.1 folate-binding protein YgfZ [Thiocystis violacea]
MTNSWRDFLTTGTARVDPDGRVRFPEPTAPTDNRLFDLSHLGLIAVRGEDAASFLQGQLTNDIRELSEAHTQLSGHCSQKGRMLAAFRVMKLGDVIYLQTPAERLPDIIKRLRMFVLRAKVTLSDASDELVRIGLAGDRAPEWLAEQELPTPERDNDLAAAGDVFLVRVPGPTPRFEILGPVTAMVRLWEALATQAAPANAQDWTLLDIQAGLPTVYNQTVEAFVPQMTNMHLIDGVSFHKGCYTGQEVVARMQFLGKLKRRMYLAEVETDTPPQPGDELFSASSTSQQASGRVVDASPLAGGRQALLVVAEISAAENGEVRLGENGPVLGLQEPPYGFPREEAPAP